MVTLGFIALETSWMDVAANSLRISKHLDEVRQTGSLDAVFFPEASLTGFACLEDPVALTDVDANISRLHKSAQELGLESFIGGFVRSEGRIYNSIIQIGTGVESPRVVYSKQNLFEYAGEQYLCSPGQDTGVA